MESAIDVLFSYDCIGFDLDNTLLEYNVFELTKLVYEILTNYLIEIKGYEKKHLSKSFESGVDFLQRGLAMDFKNGNIVKLSSDGKVLKACHGTRPMSIEDLSTIYGQDLKWDDGVAYAKEIFEAWNGTLGERIRCVLDYFDVICVLVFGRLVDTLDETKDKNYTTLWPHILEGLYYMYDKDNFSNNSGIFFSALKKNPSTYMKKCSKEVFDLLRVLKENEKVLFLLTGSGYDFVSLTAAFCLGENWKDYFNVIVCFARKPGFFSREKPFLSLNGFEEGDPCDLNNDTKVVSQGNWKALRELLIQRTGNPDMKVVYVGDNAVQDVLAPVYYKCCDTIAICEELTSRGPIIGPSRLWGSYFTADDGSETLWGKITRENAKVFVPCLRSITYS